MKKFIKCSGILSLAFLLSTTAVSASDVFACVALFDVKLDKDTQFQKQLLVSSEAQVRRAGFVSERVLRNIDDLSNQYALYSRFETLERAEQRCENDLADLSGLLQRAPETHVARLTTSYNEDGRVADPDGLEFGAGAVGQIAHLGLFIPMPEHRAKYDHVLDVVKMSTVERGNAGFMGEDVLTEVDPGTVEKQSPYTPRAYDLEPMSINYGEFQTLENAEDAYIRRGADATNTPEIKYWYNAFFGALQVPHRFYIFEVIGNFPDRQRLAEIEKQKRLAEMEKKAADEIASIGQ